MPAISVSEPFMQKFAVLTHSKVGRGGGDTMVS